MAIPEFPVFKKLEFADREEISRFTSLYHPYSDFNFWSLWSWNVNQEFQISWLNKNLVIRFTDYLTGEPFYSFMGIYKIGNTAHVLLQLMQSEGITSELKLVPKFVADELSQTSFLIREDVDNFDYILDLARLAPREGSKLSTRRRIINRFKQDANPSLVILNLSDAKVQKQIIEACKGWELQKGVDQKNANHVFEAINRILSAPDFSHIAAFGVYVNGEMVGYSINEFLPHGYVMGHFMQANKEVFSGIYAYLMQETAPILLLGGGEFVNIEQDLGLPGLQTWKRSYNPLGFLNKYVIQGK